MKVVITQGEPSGIGPEVVIKALAGLDVPEDVEIRVLGDPEALAETADELELPVPAVIEEVEGTSTALAALERSVVLALAGEADAIVTAPVHKALLRAAGFRFPGQTEFFAERFDTPHHALMLAADDLRVVPVTTHISLAEVPSALSFELITDRIVGTVESLSRDFGILDPHVGVLGLNPHAGEEGHFGLEEVDMIAPAIRGVAGRGSRVTGPHPADAAFLPRSRSDFHAIVGMYHDQVLGPFKALSSGRGVNLTIGLPVVRTSPDHGTAMGIAGRGLADESSMLRAITLAIEIATNRSQA